MSDSLPEPDPEPDLAASLSAGAEHGVDDPVVDGCSGGQDQLTFGVPAHLSGGPAGVPRQDLLLQGAHPLHVVRLEDQVRDRAPALRRRRVDDHSGVRQDRAVPGRAAGQQDRGRGDGLPDTGGVHPGADELHRVVDRQCGGQFPADRVDVHRDRGVRTLVLEVQQLSDDRVRHPGVDPGAEVDDPVGEQAAVDVDRPLAERGSGGHVRDRVAAQRMPPAWSGRAEPGPVALTWRPRPIGRRCAGSTSSRDVTIPSTKP